MHNVFREGVAVVATSTWAAMQGKKALKVTGTTAALSTPAPQPFYQRMKDDLQNKEGLSAKVKGDPNSVLQQQGGQKIDVDLCKRPTSRTASLEPLNCVAHYHGGQGGIWGPVQAPEWVQDYIW